MARGSIYDLNVANGRIASGIVERGVQDSGWPPVRALHVVKPWRGGLTRQIRVVFESLFAGLIEWASTYPSSMTRLVSYLGDRKAWRSRLIQRFTGTLSDDVILVKHAWSFQELAPRDEYILWLADHPVALRGKVAPLYVRVPVRPEISKVRGRDAGRALLRRPLICCPPLEGSWFPKITRSLRRKTSTRRTYVLRPRPYAA